MAATIRHCAPHAAEESPTDDNRLLTCPLLKLPAELELRNSIYEQLMGGLSASELLEADCNQARVEQKIGSFDLAQTCRQLLGEYMSIFLKNAFVLVCLDDLKNFDTIFYKNPNRTYDCGPRKLIAWYRPTDKPFRGGGPSDIRWLMGFASTYGNLEIVPRHRAFSLEYAINWLNSDQFSKFIRYADPNCSQVTLNRRQKWASSAIEFNDERHTARCFDMQENKFKHLLWLRIEYEPFGGIATIFNTGVEPAYFHTMNIGDANNKYLEKIPG